MRNLLIKNAFIFTMTGEGLGIIENGSVHIQGNRIAAAGPAERMGQQNFQADRVIDGKGMLAVLPGFIDAHMHSGISLLRGLAQDVPEIEWMHKTIFPFLRHIGHRQLIAGALLSVMEGLRYGTTTFGDWGYPVREVLDEVYIPLGLRAVVTQAVNGVRDGTDLSPDKKYPYDEEKGEKQLQENIELAEAYHRQYDDRVRVMFGPHAMDMLSLDLLKKAYDKAREYKTFIHMHVAQGGRENRQMMLRYGRNAIDLLHTEGLLDHNLIAVHCHYASSAELKLMADNGVRMVSCPSSIGIIDAWISPLAEYIRYGGLAALGSDQACGNNNQNILAELKVGALLNKTREKDPSILPAWKMLRIATIEGARTIGMDDIIGSIEPGKRADLILFDLNTPTLSPLITRPLRNIAHNIVYAARGEEISHVIVDGKIVKENGKITILDEEKVMEEVRQAARELMGKGGTDYLQAGSQMVRDAGKEIF